MSTRGTKSKKIIYSDSESIAEVSDSESKPTSSKRSPLKGKIIRFIFNIEKN